METVITCKGNTLESFFDLRFGRAGWFCVLNEDTGKTKFLENPFKEATGGAGTKAAEKMIELGVQKIISGDFGPKAKELLDKFNIQLVVIQDENQKIQDIINQIT